MGRALQGPYPIDIIDIPITTISTFVLLCSSFAMVRALAATNENNQTGIKIWLLATAILGAIFIGFQVYEFNLFKNEGLTLGQNLFGATFFTLTGFHGAHVTLGIIWLLGPVRHLVQGPPASGNGAWTSKSAACTGTSSTSSGS